MDFGRAENIDAVDFTLPPDHPDTIGVLAAHKKNRTGKPKVYIGCAKWGRKEWVGKIYPPKTPEKNYLKFYAQNYNCIELNAVHYRIPPEAWVDNWKSFADKNFRFCPKIYQEISHIKRLKNATGIMEVYLDRMSRFGENLGTIFLQLPPNFGTKNFPDVEAFLKWFPKNYSLAVEFRNPDWFKESPVVEETFHLMKELGIASVITDAAGRRDVVHQRLTSPVAFIRFTGNSLHPTDYARIDSWTQRCKSWLDNGLHTLYFFMHHHDEQYSPELSTYLIRQMNDVCGLSIPEPKWVGDMPESAICSV